MHNKKKKMKIEFDLTKDLSHKIELEARLRNIPINAIVGEFLVESLEKRYNKNESVEEVYKGFKQILYEYEI